MNIKKNVIWLKEHANCHFNHHIEGWALFCLIGKIFCHQIRDLCFESRLLDLMIENNHHGTSIISWNSILSIKKKKKPLFGWRNFLANRFHTFHSSLNNNRKMVDHIFKYIWRNKDLVLLTTTTTMWNEDFQFWSWIKGPFSLSFDRRGNAPFTKCDLRSMKGVIHVLKEIR